MYTNIRKKLNKFADGGKIPKLSRGARIQLLISQGYTQLQAERIYDLITGWQLGDDDDFYDSSENTLLGSSAWDQFGQGGYYHAATLNMLKDGYSGTFTNDLHDARRTYINNQLAHEELQIRLQNAEERLSNQNVLQETVQQNSIVLNQDANVEKIRVNDVLQIQPLTLLPTQLKVSTNTNSNFALMSQTGEIAVNQEGLDSAMDNISDKFDSEASKKAAALAFADAGKEVVSGIGKQFGKGGESGATAFNAGIDALKKGDAKGALAGMIGGAGVTAVNAVDKFAMGDKNFGAQSEAIDGAVHTASGALMKSGNPYAMIAGAALEGVNFLTKAGGLTVQGFDVDINNSGYGNLGHMESSSSRSILGIGNGNLKDKLARRNEQARMALTAAEISADSSFEQEARMNSVENTIMNNQIALAGGLETNMLGG